MDLRVVTDFERSLEVGIAPDRGGRMPRSREELLLPLSVRERALVVGMAEALRGVGELPDTPAVQAIWRGLLTAFAQCTGVKWQEAPW